MIRKVSDDEFFIKVEFKYGDLAWFRTGSPDALVMICGYMLEPNSSDVIYRVSREGEFKLVYGEELTHEKPVT